MHEKCFLTDYSFIQTFLPFDAKVPHKYSSFGSMGQDETEDVNIKLSLFFSSDPWVHEEVDCNASEDQQPFGCRSSLASN